jgi:hypothetical protein
MAVEDILFVLRSRGDQMSNRYCWVASIAGVSGHHLLQDQVNGHDWSQGCECDLSTGVMVESIRNPGEPQFFEMLCESGQRMYLMLALRGEG